MIRLVPNRILSCSRRAFHGSFLSLLQSQQRTLSQAAKSLKCKLIDRIQDPAIANNVAIIDPISKVTYTYKELDLQSNRIANELIHRSLHSQVSAIGGLNHSPSAFVLSMLATWKIGKIFVPLSVSHSINELSYFIQDSNIGVVLCHNSNDLAAEKWGALGGGSLLELEPLTHHYNKNSLAEKELDKPIRLSGSNDALILYTSGTTGQPKGVVHTHDSTEHIITSLVECWKYQSKDKILHFLPLYHMHGIANKLLCMLWVGATVEFSPSAKAKVLWQRLIEEAATLPNNPHPLTLFMAVPTVYAKMLEYSKTMTETDKAAGVKTMQQMRLMACGSAALPDPVMDNWYALTGQRLLERYGMTELGMALSNPYEGKERKKGYVGFPMPYVTVRIVDEQGGVLTGPNQPGELQVQGKTVFKRYLNKPEATRDTFDGNWFKTGDIAEVNEEGYYKILGRNSSDIIKSAGYKISALEIERELLSHPKILEVAVVGSKHEELGEMVVAIVVLREGEKTDQIIQELDHHLSDKLAKYKTPRKYYFVSALPRNHLGKVNKKSIWKDLQLPQ